MQQPNGIPSPRKYSAVPESRKQNDKIRKKQERLFPKQQLSRKERGYGHDWDKLRNSFIQENPYCAECDRQGLVRLASEVDHIEPFTSVDDPKRLDRDNLQSLCHRCHIIKTIRDRKRRKHGQRQTQNSKRSSSG